MRWEMLLDQIDLPAHLFPEGGNTSGSELGEREMEKTFLIIEQGILLVIWGKKLKQKSRGRKVTKFEEPTSILVLGRNM